MTLVDFTGHEAGQKLLEYGSRMWETCYVPVPQSSVLLGCLESRNPKL